MLADLWPTFGIRIATPRLAMRLPNEVELVQLAELASQGVSRKLGYQRHGISRDARGDEVVVSDRLRLTVDRWGEVERPEITVTGVSEASWMFR
jgi:hypothetical protein